MSGSELVAKVVESLDVRKLAGIISIAGCFVLFGPKFLLDRTGLTALASPHLPLIALIVIAALALLLIELVIVLVRKRKGKRSENARCKFLHGLTVEERATLLQFMNGQNTASFNISDGVAGGLVRKRILYIAATAFHPFSVPHNLQPWARDYLEKNPSLLDC